MGGKHEETIAHKEVLRTNSVVLRNVQQTEREELAQALANYEPDSEAEKRLVRKIDLYLLPILWIMYVMNYIDRTNIGNAKIAGMSKDLALDDGRYAWVLSIFFFGYLICEVPSNMILSRSKPSAFLPGIMLVWGALSATMAVSKSYSTLLAFRFILGCIESGFFPGVLFLLSSWYKKAELGKRFAFFYTAAILSGAFGGLLAGGITGHLDGAHGIAGWRWLFIIEGIATAGLSIIAYFVLLDFPATTKKLSLEERQMAVVRLLYDGMERGESSEPATRLSHWQSFKAAWCDWRTLAFTILFMMIVGSGTISYFIPTITKTLGYTTVKAQYMTVPIYAVATVFTVCVGFNADRLNERRWHICGMLTFGFVAGLVCTIVENPTIRYVMVCFLAAGIWSALPLCLAWASNAISLPAEKRAIVLATVNAFGNFSSVYGSRIWPSHDSPKYIIGFGVTTAFLGLGALLAALLPIMLKLIPVKVTKAEKLSMEIKENATRNDGENIERSV